MLAPSSSLSCSPPPKTLNHQRPANLDTPDLRRGGDLELLATPFDPLAHSVDVRSISSRRGRYNLPSVGLFLWRLQAFHLSRVTAFAHGAGRFSFHPLGFDAPIYNLPRAETEITHLAEEFNVPGALRRRALGEELEALRQSIAERWAAGDPGSAAPAGPYFGAQPALQVFRRFRHRPGPAGENPDRRPERVEPRAVRTPVHRPRWVHREPAD